MSRMETVTADEIALFTLTLALAAPCHGLDRRTATGAGEGAYALPTGTTRWTKWVEMKPAT